MADDREPARADTAWPKCATSLAVFRDDGVLLIERGGGRFKGYWSLPGGHIEPGEAVRDAALREVREETGVEVALAGLVDVHEVRLRDTGGGLAAHYLIVVFCGRWRAGEPRAASDAAQARFVPLGELGGYKLTDGAAPLIRRAWDLLQAGQA